MAQKLRLQGVNVHFKPFLKQSTGNTSRYVEVSFELTATIIN